MSLTGIPLILLAACATVGTLGITVLVWRRWGRWRYLVRPAGVLLAEALLTATVGLAVNRSQQFYPTWAALFATSDPGAATYQTTAGRLDAWLAARPDPEQAQTFGWQPAGWKDWHLAAPPNVTVPAGYLQHPGWRYSAVLVVSDAAHAWTVPALPGPTVLITVTTTAATQPSTLGVNVPGELARDLRVTGHRWALVTSAGDDALARRVVTVAGGRYPAVAFVGTPAPASPAGRTPAGAGRHPTTPAVARSSPSTARPSATPKPGVHPTASPTHPVDATHPVNWVGASTAGTYDKSAAAVHTRAAGSLPSGIETAYFPATTTVPTTTAATPAAALVSPLKAALSWAAEQTPPPLAASAPEPTYLPIPIKKSSAGPHTKHAPRPGAHQPVKPRVTPHPVGRTGWLRTVSPLSSWPRSRPCSPPSAWASSGRPRTAASAGSTGR